MKHLCLLGFTAFISSCNGATPANTIKPTPGKIVTSSGNSTGQTVGSSRSSSSSSSTKTTTSTGTSTRTGSATGTSTSSSATNSPNGTVSAGGVSSGTATSASGSTTTNTPVNNLDAMTLAEAKSKCLPCHGANGSAKSKWNKADGSEADWSLFAQRALNTVNSDEMPPTPLSATDKQRLVNYLISILP